MGGFRPLKPMTAEPMTQQPVATMSSAGFIHLHVHSAYSLLKGSIKIQKLAELAKADRQPALALTDTDNMFGALEFSDKLAAYGIQPIIGCELAVDFGDQDPNARNALAAGPARIVLLAARERGYRNLMRLNSRAFLETPTHQAPHIKFEWLQGHAEDLIVLSGGPDGPISLALAADQGSSRRRAASGWRACSTTGSISNCSVTALKGNAAPRPA